MSALMDAPVTVRGRRGRPRKEKESVFLTSAPLVSDHLSTGDDFPQADEWDGIGRISTERRPYVGARVLFIQRGLDRQLMPKPADLIEQMPQTPEQIKAGVVPGWNLNVQNWGSTFPVRDVPYCGRDWKDCHWCWPDEIISWSAAAGPVE